MIERASSILKSGQGIDVEGPAREIATRMGLLETIKSRTTGEQGFKCINENSRPYATFEQGGMTQEIEIMRGDLCDVLTNAVKQKPNVELQYNRKITKIDQLKDTVLVTILQNDGHSYEEEYDAVIASDGIRSQTRDLMLDPTDTKDCIKPVDMFIAFFSVPAQPQDASYSRWQHALGGRSVVIRPVTKSFSSVYLMAVGNHPALTNSLGDRDQKVRRQAWSEAFCDVKHGEFPRILREMQVTDNFYSDQISQVKLSTWCNGRLAVVGDAAYCPAPITGQGTQLAFLGAYVLAGELANNLSDPASAFKEYDKRLRAYVEQVQQVPLGGNPPRAPYLANPQTWWGIWLLQTAMQVVAWTVQTRLWKLVPDMDEKRDPFKLPDYNFGKD